MTKIFKNKLILIVFSLFVLSLCLSQSVLAYDFEKDSGLKSTGKLTGHTEIKTENVTLLRITMPLLGIIYLLLMMYGGYLWMTAQGNEQQVTKAKNIIVAATIGLVIALASYAIAIYFTSIFSEGFVAGT